MADIDHVNILLVDDQPSKLLAYEAVLKDLDANLVKASSAREAFDYLLKNDVAVILVDVFMPELDGFQLANMVRDHPRFEKTAIIFISAVYLSEMDRLRGYESGAVDYVPVPVVPEILRAKVKVFLELYRKSRALARLNRDLEERVAERTAELKASNDRLKQSEERLRLASEAAEFGTYDCNPGTGLIYCSPQMKRLLGWKSSGELTVESFIGRVHEADRAAVRRCLTGMERSEDGRHRIEFRVVHEGGERWLLDCGRAFFEDSANPVRVMGAVLDLTERKQVEERHLLLMAELDHRVKNILANVGALAKLSSKSSRSVQEFVDALDARIQAISKAHSMLRRDAWIGVDLNIYLSELLAPFLSRQVKNLILKGEPIDISPKAAQSLALVFHELATNALKHGALSAPSGKVTISWERLRDREGVVRLTWREEGGPPPLSPRRHGFGSMVIDAAAAELGARATYAFEPDGIIFTLDGAIEQTRKGIASHPIAFSAPISPPIRNGSSRLLRFLLVEDELLPGLQIKSELEAAGHKVVGVATNVAQGLELVRNLDFDIALLDIRLGDETSAPIADEILAKGLPFVFVTGFEDNSVLPEHLHRVPRFAKPIELSHFLAAIAPEPAAANLTKAAP